MSGVPGPSVQSIVIPDPKDIQNPSLKYAMMQLTTANNLRQDARTKMDNIADVQSQQKIANSYLDVFRQAQSDAANKNGEGEGKKYIKIREFQIDWLKSHNIKYPSKVDKGDLFLSGDEWDLVCKGTQSYIEGIGANMQQQMVLAQDALGQYNSYVQGASSSVNSGLETSKYVNRGQ